MGATWLDAELSRDLDALAATHLLREPPEGGRVDGAVGVGESGLLNLCSNDYLGYGTAPLVWTDTPGGAGASRLVHGEHPAHREAEQALSEWLGAESALLFSSGYAANVGTVSALARRGDLIVSDALNHASLIDGCRLSGATVRIAPHNDAGAVEERLSEGVFARRWVVTESYFSMDGDSPDLGRLRAICDRHKAALVVDEAHALGVFGPSGRGLCAAEGVRADVRIGTLGKAMGLQGAFVVGSRLLRTYLWNRARSFVFSTGMSPGLARGVARRVREVAADDAARTRLHLVANALRGLVSEGGFSGPRPGGRGPIVPAIVGDAARTLALSRALRERGLLVQAIRPPTVPEGTARLRITANARLSDGELARATRIFREVLGVTPGSGQRP